MYSKMPTEFFSGSGWPTVWAEEAFKYIVRYGDAKIYGQLQYPYGIIHFDPFKSRKENISFMDEKHAIRLQM